MTDDTTNQTTASKAPSHDVLHVRDYADDSHWTRIGAAWPHKDGKGFNIQVDVMPLNGRLSLRVPKKKA